MKLLRLNFQQKMNSQKMDPVHFWTHLFELGQRKADDMHIIIISMKSVTLTHSLKLCYPGLQWYQCVLDDFPCSHLWLWCDHTWYFLTCMCRLFQLFQPYTSILSSSFRGLGVDTPQTKHIFLLHCDAKEAPKLQTSHLDPLSDLDQIKHCAGWHPSTKFCWNWFSGFANRF